MKQPINRIKQSDLKKLPDELLPKLMNKEIPDDCIINHGLLGIDPKTFQPVIAVSIKVADIWNLYYAIMEPMNEESV